MSPCSFLICIRTGKSQIEKDTLTQLLILVEWAKPRSYTMRCLWQLQTSVTGYCRFSDSGWFQS